MRWRLVDCYGFARELAMSMVRTAASLGWVSVAAFALTCLLSVCAVAQSPDASIVVLRGRTMGTTWMVRYVADENAPDDVGLQRAIVEVLEEVNDQMSTWRENSEISRFNRSESTDWFPVSKETARGRLGSNAVFRAKSGRFRCHSGPACEVVDIRRRIPRRP